MAGEREVDQARNQRVVLKAQDSPDVARRDAGALQQSEQLRQVTGCAYQHILVGRAQDRVTQGDRAASVEPEEICGGQHP